MLLLAVPHPAAAQQGAVLLQWRLGGGDHIRLSTHGAMSFDSAPTLFTTRQLFRLSAQCPPPPRGAACDVAVAVEHDQYGMGADTATADASLHELRDRSASRVRLAPDGSWGMVAHDSSLTYASGFVVENLHDWLPLTLPTAPVRPGDRWPVHLFSTRTTQQIGLLQSTFDGHATLDSVATRDGRRLAWISVEGDRTDRMANDRQEGTMRSTILWDLEAGAPLEATTTQEGDYHQAPGQFTTTPVTRHYRSRSDLRRIPADSAAGKT